jgi:pilus assembly protein CpaC
VSALDFSNAVTISGYTIPAISTRRAETQVELRSGQTFAISGLLDHRTIDIYNKMPGAGDIPLLGKLFRSKSTTKSSVELVVLVTPILLDPLGDETVPAHPVFPSSLLDQEDFDKTLPKVKPATPPQPPASRKP